MSRRKARKTADSRIRRSQVAQTVLEARQSSSSLVLPSSEDTRSAGCVVLSSLSTPAWRGQVGVLRTNSVESLRRIYGDVRMDGGVVNGGVVNGLVRWTWDDSSGSLTGFDMLVYDTIYAERKALLINALLEFRLRC
jgi:hypothetical protein